MCWGQRQPGDSHCQHSREESHRSHQHGLPLPALGFQTDKTPLKEKEWLIGTQCVPKRIRHGRQLLCGSLPQRRDAVQVQMHHELPKPQTISTHPESEELGQNQNSLNFSTVPNPPVMTAISTGHLHPLQSYNQVYFTL